MDNLLKVALVVAFLVAIVYWISMKKNSTEGYSASLSSWVDRAAVAGHDYTGGIPSAGGIRARTLQSNHPSVVYSEPTMV